MLLWYISVSFQHGSYPGVFTDVPTGHLLSLHPQLTGLGSGQMTNVKRCEKAAAEMSPTFSCDHSYPSHIMHVAAFSATEKHLYC